MNSPDLVVTSRGDHRLDAFRSLAWSLATCRGFGGRLIVIDQSSDGSVGDAAAEILGKRAYVLRSRPCSLSQARNLARHLVTAPIVGFPDDDAVYFPDTLDALADTFANPAVHVLCGRLVDPTGQHAAGMVRAPRVALSSMSLWRVLLSATSSTLFLRHPGWEFAEDLGAGTAFGAGEDIELVGRLMAAGGRVAFSPAVRIGHPVTTTRSTSPAKIRCYARGYAVAALRIASATGSLIPLAHMTLTMAAGVAGVLRHPHDTVLRTAYMARILGITEGVLRRVT